MADIVPTTTDRGFKRLDPIKSIDGRDEVQAYESSLATEPAIWVTAAGYVMPAERGNAPYIAAHLSLENAVLLRDQLTYLIDNHYQDDHG